MSINLSKGDKLNLNKAAPDLTKVFIGAGWDGKNDAPIDLDLSAFVLDTNGKVVGNEDGFIYYGHQSNDSGTVMSSGDNRTGEGDGDDEVMTVDLAGIVSKLPTAAKVVAVLTRYDGKGVALGEVANASVRVVNAADNNELAKTSVVGNPTAMGLTFIEIAKDAAGHWHVQALNEYGSKDLGAMAAAYGVA